MNKYLSKSKHFLQSYSSGDDISPSLPSSAQSSQSAHVLRSFCWEIMVQKEHANAASADEEAAALICQKQKATWVLSDLTDINKISRGCNGRLLQQTTKKTPLHSILN